MSQRPSRNEPCPCGSGKKFKKCHGSGGAPGRLRPQSGSTAPVGSQSTTEVSGTIPSSHTSASVHLAGFPGQNQRYIVVNEFRDKRPSDPTGQPGEYKVVFILSRPGRAPRTDRDVSFNLGSEGDSHLSISAPHVQPPGSEGNPIVAMKLEHTRDGRTVRMVCRPNERGFIAWIEAVLWAHNFTDAELEASRALTPALSDWSTTWNIPLFIYQVEVTEVRTGNSQVSVTMPFYDAPASGVSPKGLSEDFLWFAALYREALNTNSPLYRFLCVYKIIEGIVVRRGVTKVYPKLKERVPDNPAEFNGWLHAIFPLRPTQWDAMALDSVFVKEAVGRSVGDIREKHLRPIRNDIGHLFSDEEITSPKARLWVDDPLQTMKVHHWLPVAICIARLMLKNEFPDMYLSFLDEQGNTREQS